MANDAWSAVDHNYEVLGKSVYCAYFDIIGYKRRLGEYYNGAFGLVGRLKRAIAAVNSMRAIMEPTQPGGSVRFISDAVLLTYPRTSHGLACLLHDAGMFAAHLAMEELFVRGGIADGLHFDEKAEGVPVLVSEALKRAYELESKAVLPRIVIDPALEGELSRINSRYVIEDGEHLIVHFLQRFVKGRKEAEDLYKELVDVTAWRDSSPDDHARKKNDYLVDYYAWTVRQTGFIDEARMSAWKGSTRRFTTYAAKVGG